VNVQGIGAFPNLNYIRVVWAGVAEGHDEIISVQRKIDQELVAILLLAANFAVLAERHFIATERKVFALDLRINHENFGGAAKFSARLLASVFAFVGSLPCLRFLSQIIILAITVGFVCSLTIASYLGARKFGRRRTIGVRSARYVQEQTQAPIAENIPAQTFIASTIASAIPLVPTADGSLGSSFRS